MERHINDTHTLRWDFYVHPQYGLSAGRQPVTLPLESFAATKICGQTYIDR